MYICTHTHIEREERLIENALRMTMIITVVVNFLIYHICIFYIIYNEHTLFTTGI